jgi:glyoxylase-like metal-dependent hydrolase (beta-lactamase superfamily II)
MSRHVLLAVICLGTAITAAWWGASRDNDKTAAPGWTEVAPGVYRTAGYPAGYALVEGDSALLIDAPLGSAESKPAGVKKIELVLLTHHHRDVCAAVGRLLEAGVKVQAAKEAAEWLTPDNVKKYWKESLPLRSSRTAYLVVPVGFDGVDCSLTEGQKITWRGWTIQAVATPGHARDHLAYAVRKGEKGPLLAFCGGALASAGKMWSPYTTDWDHWTDAGLTPAAKSLRKLAELGPATLLPAHGPIIAKDAAGALRRTAEVVEEVAFLKSFERYTKKRLGNAPAYKFLAREQAESNGSRPWSQVSKRLFLTGNTYVLTSADSPNFLVIDPWGQTSVKQIAKLQAERKLGTLEVVMFSHAHWDHYDGIYDLPQRERFEVWMLDRAAGPVAEPFQLRAPFLDARPVRIDRRPKEGDTLAWREFKFRFHHFPGQTEFTMGVETEIDGKRCYFTADNFFHQDMFSGSGGWMGLNRSWPLPYAESAQKVLDAAPDWVLAEHGGPFEFNAEDFRRRVEWGKVSARAADALCPSGNHRHDWDPHHVRVEPLIRKAKAGAELKYTVVIDNRLDRARTLQVTLDGRDVTKSQTLNVTVAAGATSRWQLTVQLAERLSPGRHIVALRSSEGDTLDGADAFLGVDVEP